MVPGGTDASKPTPVSAGVQPLSLKDPAVHVVPSAPLAGTCTFAAAPAISTTDSVLVTGTP